MEEPSELTQALDHLLETLACHGEPVEMLRPGLSFDEIEQMVSMLPYRVPQEVYGFYQWRNGRQLEYIQQYQNPNTVYIIPFYEMMTLRESVNHAATILRHDGRVLDAFTESCDVWNQCPSLLHFPLLNLHESFFCIQGGFSGLQTGTIFDHRIDDPPVPVANSLLSFVRAINECWETGVYSINPHPRTGISPFDDFLIDEERQREVFGKYRRQE